jgi:hypothetical protein
VSDTQQENEMREVSKTLLKLRDEDKLYINVTGDGDAGVFIISGCGYVNNDIHIGLRRLTDAEADAAYKRHRFDAVR